MVAGVIEEVQRWEDADLNGFVIEMPDTDDGDESGEAAGEGDDGGDQQGDDQQADDGQAGNESDESGAQGGDGNAAGGDGEPETPDCDFRDWPPDEVERYEARLVNRKADDSPEADTTLWIGADVEFEEDTQFLINEHEECGDGYIGVELEDIGEQGGGEGERAEEDVEDFEEGTPAGEGDGVGAEEPEDGDGTGAAGPGFGVLAALAGAAGLGGLLARRRGE